MIPRKSMSSIPVWFWWALLWRSCSSWVPSIHPDHPFWSFLGTGKLVCVLGFRVNVLLRWNIYISRVGGFFWLNNKLQYGFDRNIPHVLPSYHRLQYCLQSTDLIHSHPAEISILQAESDLPDKSQFLSVLLFDIWHIWCKCGWSAIEKPVLQHKQRVLD